MSAGTITRDKIITLGRDFIQQLGYHSFKYQLIANELQIKNAAVHHYFPAKEDLGIAIIEKDRQDFLALIQTQKNSNATGKAELYLGLYTSYNKTGKNLCVIGACASAFTDLPERMGQAAQRYFETVHSWLTKVLREGQTSGEFTFEGKPEDLAALWISALGGALQMAKVGGDSYFKLAVAQLRKSLKHD